MEGRSGLSLCIKAQICSHSRRPVSTPNALEVGRANRASATSENIPGLSHWKPGTADGILRRAPELPRPHSAGPLQPLIPQGRKMQGEEEVRSRGGPPNCTQASTSGARVPPNFCGLCCDAFRKHILKILAAAVIAKRPLHDSVLQRMEAHAG